MSAAVRRQRVAAYALVTDADRVLLTRLAECTPRPGLWTLPGGGIDHGEHPEDTVRREVHEETGLVVTSVRLLGLDSERFTATSPAGVLEDYHSVRLLYAAEVAEAGPPRVLEPEGTTDLAGWVPVRDLDDLPLSPAVRIALGLAADGAVPP